MQILFNVTGFYDGSYSNVIPFVNTREILEGM